MSAHATSVILAILNTHCFVGKGLMTSQLQIDFRFDEPETQGTTGQSARQTAVTAARSKKARRSSKKSWEGAKRSAARRSHAASAVVAKVSELSS